MHDYHAHSNYSDGRLMPEMVSGAEAAGLEGIGFADHCNVTQTSPFPEVREAYGFNLDLTYERRRAGIESLRERHDIAIYDAVEMDYRPADEDAIADFLEEADFDYAIGSVHTVDGRNLHDERYFGEKSDGERRAVIDTYVDRVVSLIDSELFAIAAHLDLPERNEALRGLFTEEHYRRIAEALERSSTVPELNAGRYHEDYGQFHPGPEFREVLAEYDVQFVRGSDAHVPESVVANNEALTDASHDLQTIRPDT
jgi:histidinol-phosphatase (PHP family)